MNGLPIAAWRDAIRRWAWVPVPLLAVGAAALWLADVPGVWDPQLLLLVLNVVFFGVAGAAVAYLVTCSFVAAGSPSLLLLGCGVVFWGLAGIVAPALSHGDANLLLTVHNSCVWLSALCHLGGVCASLAVRRPLRRTTIWVVGFYMAVLGVVWALAWATLKGAMPLFFVVGHGATTLRWCVLGSSALMFGLTAVLLLRHVGRSTSVFSYWYAMAMALIAVGLAGVMVQRFPGCAVSWVGRSAQYLGGAYMLVAAAAAWRESGARGLRLDAVQLDDRLLRILTPRHLQGLAGGWRYSLAVLIVGVFTFLRWAMIPVIGTVTPNSLSILAVTLVTILLGFGPGMMSVALSYIGTEVLVLGTLPASFTWTDAARLGLSMVVGVILCCILHGTRAVLKRAVRSESRLATFAAATFEGIVESQEGRIVDCNEQFAAMTGYTIAELKGMTVSELAAPEDRERVMGNILANRLSSIEHAMIRKDGIRVIVETHGRPLAPDSGLRHTAVRDVTSRVRADEAMRSQSLLLASINHILALGLGQETEDELCHACLIVAESVTDSQISFIGEMDADGRLYNLVAGDVGNDTGMSAERNGHSGPLERLILRGPAACVISVGLSLIVNDPPSDPGSIGLPVGGPPLESFLGVPLKRDGRTVGVIAVGNRRGGYGPDEQAAMEALAPVIIETLARKRAKTSLQASEERHRILAETMLQGVVHQGADGMIIAMNPAAERILGKTREEFIGSSSVQEEHHTIHEDGSRFPGTEHPAMVAIRTGKPVRSVVMGVFNPRRNQRRWITIDAMPVFVADEQRPSQVYTVFEDITERKEREEALRQSRAAALNLMEEAVAARRLADEVAGELRKSQEELRRHAERLDANVRERTAELAKAVVSLQQEVDRRKAAEKTLERQARQLRQLATELTLAEQRERRRLARVLHDDLQQLMAAAKLRLAPLRRDENESVRSAATEADGLLAQSIATSRTLAGELSPPILHDKGLVAAIEWLQRWMLEKHGLNIELSVDEEIVNMGEDVTAVMFHSVRELLFNCVKHAGVKSASVSIRQDGKQVLAVVSDEGVGFDISQLVGVEGAGGYGLFSIQERFAAMGGSLSVESKPGRGSRFTLVSPPVR